MSRKSLFLIIVLLFFLIANHTKAQESNLTPSSETAQEVAKELTPSQKQAVQQELSKTGGVLTPQAIEAIRKRPEFQGLSPEEVIKGKELLEKGKPKSEELPLPEKKIQEAKPKGKGKISSLFEKYLAVRSGALEVSTKLRPFGYNIFLKPFTRPLPAQPVAPDYIIGPGDEIQVLIWGRVNATYTLKVNPDGRIMFPQIGPLTVAGMRYDEMKDFLTKQATRIIGANVAITLASLHQIQVFVLGEVRNPGPYNLSAMSTILDALMAAGGPTGRGSLRRVSLKRDNKVISELDVYDLLLKGDKSHDKRLRQEDIVFVPLAGPLVGIAGNVRRPAIYELKKELTLDKALKLAGGLLPVAWDQKIQVERLEGHGRKIVLDIKARDKKNLTNFRLKDGDLVKVFSIIPEAVNSIQLAGNVSRPGTYAYHPGMRLSEIIKSADDLLPDTYFDYALIKRYIPTTLETELVPFNLGAVVKKKEDIRLRPLDRIYIFSKWFFEEKPTASVEGEVRKPGSYEIPEKEFRIKDLILLAGGLKKDAYLKKAELYRLDKEHKKRILITFDLENALKGDPKDNLLLRDLDKIVVHSMWEYMPKQTVSVWGEVNNPGQYPFVPGMRVSDLVFAGGNVKESAYLKEAEISSYKIINGELSEVSHRSINLERALKGNPEDNVLLKPYDKLFVRKISEWGREEYVEISGEVLFPGRYVIKKGERLSSLIGRAGGFTPKAYLPGAVFTRKRIKELQQRQLNEMLDRLERELLATGTAEASAALSAEEAKMKATETAMKRRFLERLRQIEAKGRLVIHLRPLPEFKGSPYDIQLEDGDTLYIPPNPQTVQVVGAVYNQTAFIYKPGAGVSYYIDLAGGYTASADKKHMYILKVDGSATRKTKGLGFHWNPFSHRWEIGARSAIEPGDTIIVPQKLEKIAWLRNIKDITQILYQVAVTTGVAIAAID